MRFDLEAVEQRTLHGFLEFGWPLGHLRSPDADLAHPADVGPGLAAGQGRGARYSSIGPRLRRRWWPADPPEGCLTGRRALVTGATSGLGTATAIGLARLGATVHLLGRDRGRTDQTRMDVAAQVEGAHLETEICDVSDLSAVRTFAADGDARALWMSSGGMYGQRLDAGDLEYTQGSYSGVAAYARTKWMQVVLAEQLTSRLQGSGVSVHSLHPGWVDTPGITSSLPRFHTLTGPLLRDPAAGADTVVWLAAAPEAATTSGLFWHDRRARPTAYGPWQREPAGERDRLWQQVSDLTGVSVD